MFFLMNYGIDQDLAELADRLVAVCEKKDAFSLGHARRVAFLSALLAARLGASDIQVSQIALGAYLHDVGKAAIPKTILEKAGPLNDDERALIQRHPKAGFDLLRAIGKLTSGLDIVHGHHELLDGSGYPKGLIGDQITMEVRVVTVADVYDAMTADRSYRPAIERTTVIQHLKMLATSGKLDYQVVDVLADIDLVQGVTPHGNHQVAA